MGCVCVGVGQGVGGRGGSMSTVSLLESRQLHYIKATSSNNNNGSMKEKVKRLMASPQGGLW